MKSKWNDYPKKVPDVSPTLVYVRTAEYKPQVRIVALFDQPAVFILDKFYDLDGITIHDVSQWRKRR